MSNQKMYDDIYNILHQQVHPARSVIILATMVQSWK